MSTKTTKTAEEELEEALDQAESKQGEINDDDFIGEVAVKEQEKIVAGSYEVQICDITKELSKAKEDKPSKPMVVWEFKILGPTNKGFKFKAWILLEEFNWNMANIAKALGIPPVRQDKDEDNKNVDVYAIKKSECLNKYLVIEIKPETNDDDQLNIKIKKYIAMTEERKNHHLGI